MYFYNFEPFGCFYFIINKKDNDLIRHEEMYYKTAKNTGQKLMSFM